MCSLESFKIDLKGLKEDEKVFSYNLNDNYFEEIKAPEVRKGNLNVRLSIRKTAHFFEFNFHTEGIIQIPCDRCLDDMEQKIATDNKIVVKFGEEYSEEDDLVTIPEDEGIIDVAWFIYEFIVLNVPIKHVHAPGKCNPAMLEVLEKHTVARSNDGNDENSIDPRWSELEKLKTIIKD